MRTKLAVGLLVLSLAVSGLGVISATSTSVAAAAVQTDTLFLKISICPRNYNFGRIPAGTETHRSWSATELTIYSNIAWNLSYAVTGPVGTVAYQHLTVHLSKTTSDGCPWGISVGVCFILIDLLWLPPGIHTATVSFTVTAR